MVTNKLIFQHNGMEGIKFIVKRYLTSVCVCVMYVLYIYI